MAKRNGNLNRHFYELTVRNGRNHKNYDSYHKFISARSWASLDYTGSPHRVADSSLALEDFRVWVSNETGIAEKDILVEEITSTSADHDDRRELIERYFRVTL
ncbi:hypothetical protein [Rhizobium laguerreae]|uniref:hypothetical protein n=1 Tax=Rhizobium laguerreae TaxID=1076926 RepID=UPI001C8FDA1E|nr:hypothetical protein [Rhizobium laguerreae]MBY3247433.1 hypothetical protein [Rhizobium laguerreae]